MRTAGLAMLAAGAILTFAVSAQVPGINLRLAGLILIVAGLAGLIAPSRAGAWASEASGVRGVRRRILAHGDAGPGDAVGGDLREAAADDPGDADYPAYLMQDPAVLAAEVLNSARVARMARTAGQRGPQGLEREDQEWHA